MLPDGPGATGRGSPCADLWDGGPALARTDPPAIEALFTESFFSPSGYRATSSNGTARCYLISQLSASWACRPMVEFDALWLRSEQEGMLLPVKPRIFILGSESYLCTYTERLWFRTTRKLS